MSETRPPLPSPRYENGEEVLVKAVVRGNVDDKAEWVTVRIRIPGGVERILIVPVEDVEMSTHLSLPSTVQEHGSLHPEPREG